MRRIISASVTQSVSRTSCSAVSVIFVFSVSVKLGTGRSLRRRNRISRTGSFCHEALASIMLPARSRRFERFAQNLMQIVASIDDAHSDALVLDQRLKSRHAAYRARSLDRDDVLWIFERACFHG